MTPSAEPSRTVWILGDQLNAGLASIRDADPARDRILMIRSEGKIDSKPFHPLRLRLALEAMDHFSGELRGRGFQVDHRTAASFAEGVEAHRREFRPESVRAMEPMSWDGLRTMERLGVETVRSDQFLCHYEEFAEWAAERSGRLVMEDFYRRQRVRLGYLMDGDEPAGGRWNWDGENRRPPPRDGGGWPRAGRDADWPVTRRQALARLRSFTAEVLPRFGPHQDAMLAGEWRLAHSLLSSSMNIGLLHRGRSATRCRRRTGRARCRSRRPRASSGR